MFTSENCKFSCLNWPRDLKNRSRSSIFELNQDTLEIHPWYKFGPNAIIICWVIVFTSGNWKFSCLNWPRDLQNRSRSSIFELNQDTLEIHPWYKFGPNAINICWVIVFTSENWKLSCLNWPRDLQNRSRSSIFELNQDTLEIHPWYKFGPNAINICWVIVFTSEFHVYIDRDLQNRSRSSIFELNQDTSDTSMV